VTCLVRAALNLSAQQCCCSHTLRAPRAKLVLKNESRCLSAPLSALSCLLQGGLLLLLAAVAATAI
jgi:hypothetical protein